MFIERTLTRRCAYQGRILRVEEVAVEMENGRQAHREIVRHAAAVAVLARRPDGRFVLVRQFRKAAERVLLEVVAGGIEPGEAPEACARRELREETGYGVIRIASLGSIFLSPGYCDEVLHLFFAEVEAVPLALSPDEDERLEPVLLDAAELRAALAPGGGIEDSKTLALWARYRAGGSDREFAGGEGGR
jgi:ADP-ribose pyrophosphatase